MKTSFQWGRWSAIAAAVLMGCAAANSQAQSAAGAGARRTDQQKLKLDYSEDQAATKAPPKKKGGGGLVGAINNVTEEIKGAGADGKDAKKLSASSEVDVEAYVQQQANGPWVVTLKANTSGASMDPALPGPTKGQLQRESRMLVDGLNQWRQELTDAQMQALKDKGEVSIAISEPLGVLSKWSKPALEIRVKNSDGAPTDDLTASSTDPVTGITTSSERNSDGSRTVTYTDRNGNVLGTERIPAPGAGGGYASVTDPATGITTKSESHPDGSRTVTRTDRDGKVLSTEKMPPPGAETEYASSTDPETGITTRSGKRADGSRVVTKTDKDGNVISTELHPPKGQGTSVASSTDPKTGITTRVEKGPDGKNVVTESRTRREADGSTHITSSDNRGNRTETVVAPDGGTTITRTNPRGEKMVTERNPDGSVSVTKSDPGGSKVVMRRDAEGAMTKEIYDHNGNKTEVRTREAANVERREDSRGNVTRVETKDGITTETKMEPNGNVTVTKRNETGEVIAREEKLKVPKEPGQEYFETVLKGDDWQDLPQSLKNRYADSESSIRNAEEMENLRNAQEAERVRVAEETKAFSADLQAKTDAKLAAIQEEQKQADRKAAARAAVENRQREVAECLEKGKELQKEYDAAMARGDKAEARRISDKQDEHAEASMKILEFTDDERRVLERKQGLRDNLVAEITASARAEAATKVDQDWQQELKDGVTGVTRHLSMGSQMQQDTAASTRRADFEVAFAEAKKERLLRRLNDPKTTAEERKIIGDMIDFANVQEEGGLEQLSANARLTAAGYAIDVGMLAAGGPLTKGVGLLVGKAGQQSVGKLVGTGVLSATERLAGREAAEVLARRAAVTAEATKAAATKVTDSAVGKVLSRDVATGAQAESRWLTNVVEETVKETAIGAGAQLALTGKIDVEDLVAGSLAGGAMGGTVTSALGPPTRPTPDAPQPVSQPTPNAATPSLPTASVATPSAPMTQGSSGLVAAVSNPPVVNAANGGGSRTSPAPPSVRPDAPATPANQPVASATPRPEPVLNAAPNTTPPPQPTVANSSSPVSPRPSPTPTATPPNSPANASATPPPSVAPRNANTPPANTASRKPRRDIARPRDPEMAGATPSRTARSEAPAEVTQPLAKGREAPTPNRATPPVRSNAPDRNVAAADSAAARARADTRTDGGGGAKPVEMPNKPTIVRPDEPGFKPAVADRARAETRTDGAAREKPFPLPPKKPGPLPPRKGGGVAKSAEKVDANGIPDRLKEPAGPRRPAREALTRVRDRVPDAGKPHFDQTMDVVNRLIEADPRFRDVDYEQVAQQALIRGDSMTPEAAAALALNYQGHRGARVTPEALASATGVTSVDAEGLVRSGWDRVKIDPGDIHNGGPGSIRVEEFDPTAGPKVEEFILDTPNQDPAAEAAARARAEASAAKYADSFQGNAERSRREAVDEPEIARRQHVAEAEVFGRYTDSWELTPEGAAQIVNPDIRKLIPGDADYLGNLMSENQMTVIDADGNTVFNGTLRPSQESVCGEVINNYVLDILNTPVGEFPRSIDIPNQLIEICPDGTIGDGGHHRVIAAIIASRITGRPLTGGPNPIIPASQIRIVPKGERVTRPGWRLRVDPPRDVVGADLGAMRELANDFRFEARTSGTPEVAGALTRQAAHLDWQADLLESGVESGKTDLRN